jgi:hypothetical protein
MLYASEINVLREILRKAGATPGDTLYVIIGDGDQAPVFRNIQKSPHIMTIDPTYRPRTAIPYTKKRGLKHQKPRFGKNVQVIGKPALTVPYVRLFKEYQGIKNIAFISICAHVNADVLFRKVRIICERMKVRIFFAVRKCCNRLMQSHATESFVIPKGNYTNRVTQFRRRTSFLNVAKTRKSAKTREKLVSSRYITEYYYPSELKASLNINSRPVANRLGKLVPRNKIAY